MKADLHTHTTASDGKNSPTDLIKKAEKAGLSAIAITDHDSVSGIAEAVKSAKRIEVIPGAEFSCGLFNKRWGDREFHLVGLFINPKDNTLRKTLEYIRTKGREKRVRHMLRSLKKYFKINISFKEILEANKKDKSQLGKIQLTSVLIKRGYATDWATASKYTLPIDVPVYYKIEDAIKSIKKAGGLSFLAHPLNSMYKPKRHDNSAPKSEYKDYEKLLKYLKQKGMDGIETNYAWISSSEKKFLKRMVKKYGFLESGGTDFHTEKQKNMPGLGEMTVPYSYVRKMKKVLQKKLNNHV